MNPEAEKMPGSMDNKLADAVRILLAHTGDNPARESLKKTPERVTRMWQEFFSGHAQNLEALFEEGLEEDHNYDGLVLLKNIKFYSFCEHHLLPMVGQVHIGYLPAKKIAGLSKLARLVDIYARRLQMQEKMTAEIAESLMQGLAPKGVMVAITAEHFCMTMRGIAPGAKMMSFIARGVFEKQNTNVDYLRQDFLAQIQDQ